VPPEPEDFGGGGKLNENMEISFRSTKDQQSACSSHLGEVMSNGADISTLYREFTQALTEPNTLLVRHLVLGSPGLGLLSKSTLNTVSMDIFWRSKLHLSSGKPCKLSVTWKGLRSQGKRVK
jgi:hypothetical protein